MAEKIPTPFETKVNIPLATLPANAITVASIIVFIVIITITIVQLATNNLALQIEFEQETPYLILQILSIITACLILLITFTCRDRPGSFIPRIWLVFLTLISIAIASILVFSIDITGIPILKYLNINSSLLYAFIIATFVATLTLAPRLGKISPHNKLLQFLGIIVLLISLLLGSIGTVVFNQYANHHANNSGSIAPINTNLKQALDQFIAECNTVIEKIEMVVNYPWDDFTTNISGAKTILETAQTFDLQMPKTNIDIWQENGHPEIISKQALAKEKVDTIYTNLLQAIQINRLPKLSDLEQPSSYWDDDARQWIENPNFKEYSRIVGQYYILIDNLFHQLTSEDSVINEIYQQKSANFESSIRETLNIWADNWMPYQLHNASLRFNGNQMALKEIFETKLTNDLSIVNIRSLLELTLETAKNTDIKSCFRREYTKGSYEYFRLDCYAYAPTPDETGAQLRIEMRIVYQGRKFYAHAKPVEIYFLFPLGNHVENYNSYKSYIMNSLFEALSPFWVNQGGNYSYLGSNGTPSKGFYLKNDKLVDDVYVYEPREVGHVNDFKAIEVRIEYR